MDNQQRLKDIEDRFSILQKGFDLVRRQNELKALEQKSQDPDFWQDSAKAQKVMQKISVISGELNSFEKISKEIIELAQMLPLEAEDPKITQELSAQVKNLDASLKDLEIKMYMSGPYDVSSAILSIHAGQGGTEAMDWVEMLSRMYQKYLTWH